MKPVLRHFRPVYGMVVLLLAILVGGSCFGMEPDYVPFDYKVAATLLKNTVARKLVPHEFKSDGMTLNIIKLNQFQMDWEKSQFHVNFGFRASYNKSFINLERAGEASVTGSGLMSSGEQKLGAKILRINSIKLEGGNEWIDSAARTILDKSLSGKEFWYGTPPTSSEELTKDNLGLMLQVALNQILPQTFTSDGTTVTLNRVEQLSFGTEPGIMESLINMNGIYQKLLKLDFSGQIGLIVQVLVDPEQLVGKITIDRVTNLELDKSPVLLGGIIKKMVSAKLKGKVVEYSWK